VLTRYRVLPLLLLYVNFSECVQDTDRATKELLLANDNFGMAADQIRCVVYFAAILLLYSLDALATLCTAHRAV
jgi:hypothetical protein